MLCCHGVGGGGEGKVETELHNIPKMKNSSVFNLYSIKEFSPYKIITSV